MINLYYLNLTKIRNTGRLAHPLQRLLERQASQQAQIDVLTAVLAPNNNVAVAGEARLVYRLNAEFLDKATELVGAGATAFLRSRKIFGRLGRRHDWWVI